MKEEYLGRYTFARQTRGGLWRLYQGAWSDRATYNTVGRDVVRDATGRIREFATLEAARDWFAPKREGE